MLTLRHDYYTNSDADRRASRICGRSDLQSVLETRSGRPGGQQDSSYLCVRPIWVYAATPDSISVRYHSDLKNEQDAASLSTSHCRKEGKVAVDIASSSLLDHFRERTFACIAPYDLWPNNAAFVVE